MSAIEKNQHTCLPPEAYIHLWQKSEKSEQPKFKSTYIPKKPVK